MILAAVKVFFVYVLVIVVETSSLIQSGVLCSVIWRNGLSTKMVCRANLPIWVDVLNLYHMNSSWSLRLGGVLKMGRVAATWKADSDTSVWQPGVEMKVRMGERRNGNREEKNPGKVRRTGCCLRVFVWAVSSLVVWLYLCYAVWFHCAEWIHWACIPTLPPAPLL